MVFLWCIHFRFSFHFCDKCLFICVCFVLSGDSMKINDKQQFSTTDNNNDGRRPEVGCTSKKHYGGVWWFPVSCGYSDLNGEYKRGGRGLSAGQGLIWQGWKGFSYSLKGTQMMIRRT